MAQFQRRAGSCRRGSARGRGAGAPAGDADELEYVPEEVRTVCKAHVGKLRVAHAQALGRRAVGSGRDVLPGAPLAPCAPTPCQRTLLECSSARAHVPEE